MSARLHRLVTRRSRAAGLTYQCFCHLAMLANEKGEVRASHADMLRVMRVSEPTMLKAFKDLCAAGELRWMNKRRPGRYFVIQERGLRSRRVRFAESDAEPEFFRRASSGSPVAPIPQGSDRDFRPASKTGSGFGLEKSGMKAGGGLR